MKAKKLLASLLTLCMLLSLLPAVTLAAGETVSVASDTTSWTDGNTYVVSGEVTITSRINVSGNVTLQLNPGSTLNAQKGIQLGENGNSLTINGSGTLNATGASDHAGIGGGPGNSHGGVLVINGGTINATGGSYTSNNHIYSGAGIGGTTYGYGCDVTINGGVVNAVGGTDAAAIGGGANAYWVGSYGQGRRCVINGGVVNATARGYGAGIGGGGSSDSAGSIYPGGTGIVEINGGQVTAVSENGYGIGPGRQNGQNHEGEVGTITLGWTNASDFINVQSYRGTINFADMFLLDGTNTTATAENAGGHKIVPTGSISITFETFGGTQVAGQSVSLNDTIQRPADPVRERSVFKGWYQITNGRFASSAWDFSTPVTGKVTLGAAWGYGGTTTCDSGSPGYSGQEPRRLVDGNDNTKWCTSYDNHPWTITFHMDRPIAVTAYIFNTAEDAWKYNVRHPQSWTLEGQRIDGTWVTLDSVTNDTILQPVNNTDFLYNVDNPGAEPYIAFRWNVPDTRGHTTLQMSELTMVYDDSVTACYTVSFAANGGSGTMESVTAVYGEDYTVPECTFDPPAGSGFVCWSCGGNDTADPGDEIAFDGNTTLTAVWAPLYTITWLDGDGNTLAADSVLEGTTPSYTGTTPTKTATEQYSYSFNGTWSPAIVSASANASYTAQFDSTRLCNYVSFAANGGSGTMAAVAVPVGETCTVPECTFDPPAGSGFVCWSYGNNGTADPDDVIEPDGDITLTAVWATLYTITWLDGDGNTLAADSVFEGATPAYSGTTPTKTGSDQYEYSFNGTWSPAIVPASANATYTAQFDTEKLYHFVNFDADGGSGTMASTTVSVGETFTVPECTFDPPVGKEFVCWSYGDNETAAPDDELELDDDTTFTAVWDDIFYEVAFIPDNGDDNFTEYISYGETVDEPDAPEAPDGRTFLGWYTENGAEEYDFSEEIYEDITLRALWAYDGLEGLEGTKGFYYEDTGVDQDYTNLFDGTDEKWCLRFNDYAYVVFDAGQLVWPTDHVMVTGADAYDYRGRSPKSWTLSAKRHLDDEWTVIAEETDNCTMQDVNSTPFRFVIPQQENPPAYRFFKLEVTAIQQYDCLQLEEFYLVGVESGDLPALEITLDPGEGACDPETLSADLGDSVDLSDVSVDAPTGKVLTGWLYGEELLTPDAEFEPIDDCTLTAQFAIPCTLTFDPGAGTGEAFPVYTAAGQKITLPGAEGCGFTAPEGKMLIGWTCGDAEYEPGDSYTVSADAAFTAVWADACTVTVLCGPYAEYSENAERQIPTGETLEIPSYYDVFDEDFEVPWFLAWRMTVGEDDISIVLPGMTVTMTDDITLEPIWSPEETEGRYDLQEAIAAASNGDEHYLVTYPDDGAPVITLEEDVFLVEWYEIETLRDAPEGDDGEGEEDYPDEPDEDYLIIGSDASIVLDLNGHTIIGNMEYNMLEIDGELTVCDGVGGGLIASCCDSCPVFVAEGGALTLESGAIMGTDGIDVVGGEFTMNGGTIMGSCDDGVEVSEGGTFTMNDGLITFCDYGVYAAVNEDDGTNGGTFIMNGGTISDCEDVGVDVYCGEFIMNDGTISGCGDYGVWVDEGTAAIYDGTIADCYDTGVYIEHFGVFTMEGGTISDCCTTGVYISCCGMFVMNDGTISGCKSNGVYNNEGRFEMAGGLITGNGGSAEALLSGDAVPLDEHYGEVRGVAEEAPTVVMYGGGVYTDGCGIGGGYAVESVAFDAEGLRSVRFVVGDDGDEGGESDDPEEPDPEEPEPEPEPDPEPEPEMDFISGFFRAGGEISGNAAFYGGGVYVCSGDFLMDDGLISGNTSLYGGGVAVDNEGYFRMDGGEISGNTGSGVLVCGSFILVDGEISDNTGSPYLYDMPRKALITDEDEAPSATIGGGVFVTESMPGVPGFAEVKSRSPELTKDGEDDGDGDGEDDGDDDGETDEYEDMLDPEYWEEFLGFVMLGGLISDNSADMGGGVAVQFGSFTLVDGEISGNTCDPTDIESSYYYYSAPSEGGGVYIDCADFMMFGGLISGNTADIGGGVSADEADFCLLGGTVTGNTANWFGGGVFAYCLGIGGDPVIDGNYAKLRKASDDMVLRDVSEEDEDEDENEDEDDKYVLIPSNLDVYDVYVEWALSEDARIGVTNCEVGFMLAFGYTGSFDMDDDEFMQFTSGLGEHGTEEVFFSDLPMFAVTSVKLTEDGYLVPEDYEGEIYTEAALVRGVPVYFFFDKEAVEAMYDAFEEEENPNYLWHLYDNCCDILSCLPGETVDPPEDPVREGWEFAGWYVLYTDDSYYDMPDPYYDEPFDFDTSIEYPVSLIALWYCTVTLDPNGATVPTDDETGEPVEYTCDNYDTHPYDYLLNPDYVMYELGWTAPVDPETGDTLVFGGWTVEGEDGEDVPVGYDYELTGNTVFKAVWRAPNAWERLLAEIDAAYDVTDTDTATFTLTEDIVLTPYDNTSNGIWLVDDGQAVTNFILDLNGCVIDFTDCRPDNESLFRVYGASLTIRDSSQDGGGAIIGGHTPDEFEEGIEQDEDVDELLYRHYFSCIEVGGNLEADSFGELTLEGGAISGFGCGVDVYYGGVFTMTGGEISGNAVKGVYNSGRFELIDGCVADNGFANAIMQSYYSSKTDDDDEMVLRDMVAISDDGPISGPGYEASPYICGGGVFVCVEPYYMRDDEALEPIDGEDEVLEDYEPGFFMSGGTISKNYAVMGGGVYLMSGRFEMSGGAIAENEAEMGGGVYVADGGRLYGIPAVVESVGGDDIITEGIRSFPPEITTVFVLSGGTIAENEAMDGGGVYVDYTGSGSVLYFAKDGEALSDGEDDSLPGSDLLFLMSGGVIADNEANVGGGVFLNANMYDAPYSGELRDAGIVSDDDGTPIVFRMTGGSISGNGSCYVGGVYVGGNGCAGFEMSGGSITGNFYTSKEGDGLGGVMVLGEMFLSGDVQISGNRWLPERDELQPGEPLMINDFCESNLAIMPDTPIVITGPLTSDARVGLSLPPDSAFGSDDVVIVTRGFDGNGDAANFYGDDANTFAVIERIMPDDEMSENVYEIALVFSDGPAVFMLDEPTLILSSDPYALIHAIRGWLDGEVLTPPADPEKDGYVFDGWYQLTVSINPEAEGIDDPNAYIITISDEPFDFAQPIEAPGDPEETGSMLYFIARWTEIVELEITSQPEDYTGSIGDEVSFTVEAVGDELSYQWQYSSDGGNTWGNSGLPGNKTATLSTELTEARLRYLFRCVVTDENGDSVTSDAVRMIKEEPAVELAITAQPENYVGQVGDTVSFTVEAAGNDLSYQWQFSSDAGATWKASGLPGNDTATLTTTFTEARMIYRFRCVVTDGNGNSVTSSIVRMLKAAE